MATQDRITSRRSYYISRTKRDINLILEIATQKYISSYYQLKVKYGAVEKYLAKIRII